MAACRITTGGEISLKHWRAQKSQISVNQRRGHFKGVEDEVARNIDEKSRKLQLTKKEKIGTVESSKIIQ